MDKKTQYIKTQNMNDLHQDIIHGEVKLYRPLIFQKIRKFIGLNEEKYLECLNFEKDSLLCLKDSDSKSGQTFWISKNNILILKTIKKYECKNLFLILNDYYKYFYNCKGKSCISTVLGLYRVKLKSGTQISIPYLHTWQHLWYQSGLLFYSDITCKSKWLFKHSSYLIWYIGGCRYFMASRNVYPNDGDSFNVNQGNIDVDDKPNVDKTSDDNISDGNINDDDEKTEHTFLDGIKDLIFKEDDIRYQKFDIKGMYIGMHIIKYAWMKVDVRKSTFA